MVVVVVVAVVVVVVVDVAVVVVVVVAVVVVVVVVLVVVVVVAVAGVVVVVVTVDVVVVVVVGLFVCLFGRASSHSHANTSMTELLVNFIFSTGLRPPVNTNKFRAGKRPSYAMRESCPCSLPPEAFTFAEDLRTFQAALKWFRKHIHIALLPGDCIVNCRSLYVLGYSRPTKGISYRLKHTCEPDPRAHLQELFSRRSARQWSFEFHITPPRN